MKPSPCLGRRSGRDYAAHCHACARHQPEAAGRVVIPTFSAGYFQGVEFHVCNEWVAHEATVAPIARKVCDIGSDHVSAGNGLAKVLGGLLVAIAAAAYSVTAQAQCTWADPGANPYTGSKAEAVRKLDGIPAGTRERLAELVAARVGFRQVVVTRDQIDAGRLVDLQDMNFGAGRICPGLVDRSMWGVNHQEMALAWQEGKHVVLWFARCGNIARAIDPKARPSIDQLKEDAEAIKARGMQVVSEPGTLAMIAASLIAIFVALRKKS